MANHRQITRNVPADVAALKPRKIKIPEAVHYSKICRTELYELAKRHRGLFVKNGQATLVDVPILDAIIDGLPAIGE
jgi:hypothetical protein